MGVADRDLPRFTFGEWMNDVNETIRAFNGLTADDLEPYDYHLAWLDGSKAEHIAEATLHASRFEMGDIE